MIDSISFQNNWLVRNNIFEFILSEIRINGNAKVEVSYFRIGMNKYRLGGSYLINESSDKYRKKKGMAIKLSPFLFFVYTRAKLLT